MSRSRESLAVLLALLAACWLTADSARATIHDIDIVNFDFTPPGTVVSEGDTVRWTWVSGTHSTTSDIGAPKTWDSGVMAAAGQTFEIVITAEDGFGPFPYHCTPHIATMKDTLFYQAPTVQPMTTTLVESGFDRPVFATSPPGDLQRLFVLEQHTGLIKIYDMVGDSTYSTPFLDIGALITDGNEQGLLGLAFHPDYQSNGLFYINYTNTGGDTRVVRYQVSGDPNIADAGSDFLIINYTQPFANHNGGWIAFGPDDGYLYISAGDGGAGGDPNNNGQDSTTILGSILRIDVDGGSPYAIPGDNPFLLDPGQDEIWDYGVRNPWRCSFDRANGDFYIADVGQGDWEEINFEPGDSPGGVNYGWRLKEGTHCYNPTTNCDPLDLTTEPIHEYAHDPECSVTGGYVYRGCAIDGLPGTYFFADYCSGKVWSFRYDGNTMIDFQDRTTELGMGSFGIVSFAEDNYGELYILLQSGEIYKIIPDGMTDCNMNNIADSCEITFGVAADTNSNGIPDDCETQTFLCGDVNDDDLVNITDAVYLIQWIFNGGPDPMPLESADVNCDTIGNITDAVYIIQWIFNGGPDPCDGCP